MMSVTALQQQQRPNNKNFKSFYLVQYPIQKFLKPLTDDYIPKKIVKN